MQVTGNVLAEECAGKLRKFFAARRRMGMKTDRGCG
jgi:hypothetical protein